MKAFDNEKLNPDVADALYELSNVGVGQASIALGKMMGVGLTIGIPRVMRGKFCELPLAENNNDKVDMGILMTLENNLGGVVLFVIDKGFISDLIFKLTGIRRQGDEILEDEECLSATQEVANIIAASYTKAIGTYTGMRLYLSPAMVGIDHVKSLVSFAADNFNINGETAICVDTSFGVMDKDGKKSHNTSRIIMLPDDFSVEKLMNALDIT